METILLGAIFLVIVGIITALIWHRIDFVWLQNAIKFLIWSLPLEWFPRVDIGGAGFRLSQALVIVSFYFLFILSFKKDPDLLRQKLSKLGWILPLFIILSSPSWLNITNTNRFFVHFLGTILCFGASFLIASFVHRPFDRIKELSIVIFLTSIFGIYQYIGDMAGLPPALTGLREHYTKIVFGVPRIQGTAIEPLYFAGMLTIPIIFWIVTLFFGLFGEKKLDLDKATVHSEIFEEKKDVTVNQEFFEKGISDMARITNNNRIKKFLFDDSLLAYFSKLGFVILIFILTLSKGTYGVLAFVLFLFFIFAIKYFSEFRNMLKQYGVFAFIFLFWLSAGLSNSVDPIALTGDIGKNFVETLTGTSPSAVERNKFLGEALRHIPERGLMGIGMGQYGEYVGADLGSLNTEGQAIVNNVYVEVFLEEGFFALIWFLVILFLPLFGLWRTIWQKDLGRKETAIATITLFFILFGYYLQWNLFSPIFIMPIFILLGLAYNLNEQEFDFSKKV
jgi:ABC-type multidrug transport system fused ATPase/permease subunit